MDSLPTSDGPQLPAVPSPSRLSLQRKPSLLPAFELGSSSPMTREVPRKRRFEDSPSKAKQSSMYYPTPVPTSSTGILPSSPTSRPARPKLQRTMSQRSALHSMPSVDLPADGTVIRMGRSSNSSDYQLSVNRFISRVHVQASYHAPSASHVHGKVFIQCLGENGAKVHSGGRAYTLGKGGSFSSDNPSEEIILDVQDARVVVVWPYVPRQASFALHSERAWDLEESPSRRLASSPIREFASSPPRLLGSPISPSPEPQPELGSTFPIQNEIQVFEDADSGEDVVKTTEQSVEETAEVDAPKSFVKEEEPRKSAQSSLLSLPSDDLSDRDEENDPIIHSFGPFGDNVLGRMASITAGNDAVSPQRHRRPLKSASPPAQRRPSPEAIPKINEEPIKNHVINQLAFSRLHSMPLSTIFGNLPANLKSRASRAVVANGAGDVEITLTPSALKVILHDIPCIGQIAREGKDAAGKPLENEFYYVPEMDTDEARKHTVTGGLGKTGIRAVRKNHKQYYWKKPR